MPASCSRFPTFFLKAPLLNIKFSCLPQTKTYKSHKNVICVSLVKLLPSKRFPLISLGTCHKCSHYSERKIVLFFQVTSSTCNSEIILTFSTNIPYFNCIRSIRSQKYALIFTGFNRKSYFTKIGPCLSTHGQKAESTNYVEQGNIVIILLNHSKRVAKCLCFGFLFWQRSKRHFRYEQNALLAKSAVCCKSSFKATTAKQKHAKKCKLPYGVTVCLLKC